MLVLKTVGMALATAFDTLDTIARSKDQSVESVTVNVKETDLSVGKVVGNVTVKNRSRRGFTMSVVGDAVEVKFLGVTKRIAA